MCTSKKFKVTLPWLPRVGELHSLGSCLYVKVLWVSVCVSVCVCVCVCLVCNEPEAVVLSQLVHVHMFFLG